MAIRSKACKKLEFFSDLIQLEVFTVLVHHSIDSMNVMMCDSDGIGNEAA